MTEVELVREGEVVEEDGSWYEAAVSAYLQADEEVRDSKWARAEVSFAIVGKAYQNGDRGLIKQFAGDVRRSASHLYKEALAQNLKLRLEELGQPETSTLTPTFYIEAAAGKQREIESGDEEAIGQAGNTLAVAEDEHWTVATLREELQDPSSVHFSSKSPEWYTPEHIIEGAEKAMGGIDLDPCADSERAVPATYHYTKEDDGLAQKWSGRVYMNPPYGSAIGEWVRKLKEEYERGEVEEAIALVPARTDTEWFSVLRMYPRLFVKGRLKFSQHQNSAPFPSCLFYFGDNGQKFVEAFEGVGDVFGLVRL